MYVFLHIEKCQKWIRPKQNIKSVAAICRKHFFFFLLFRLLYSLSVWACCLGVVTAATPLSCHVLSCLIFSSRVLSCLVVSCRVFSCLVLSCLDLSCLVLYCLVLACLVSSCRALSCLVVCCRVLFCLVLSCLDLSSPSLS